MADNPGVDGDELAPTLAPAPAPAPATATATAPAPPAAAPAAPLAPATSRMPPTLGEGEPGTYYKLTFISYKWCKYLQRNLSPRSFLIPLDLKRLHYCLEAKRWFPSTDEDAPESEQPDNDDAESTAAGAEAERPTDAMRSKATEKDLQEVRRVLYHELDQSDGVEKLISLYLVKFPDEEGICVAIAAKDLRAILHALFPRLAQSDSAVKSLEELEECIPPYDTFEWSGTAAEAEPVDSLGQKSVKKLMTAPTRYIISSFDELKALTKFVGNHNKALDQKQTAVHGGAEFEQVRQIWQRGGCSFVSIDTESWERGDSTDVIELGWSILERPPTDSGPTSSKAISWTQKSHHRVIFEYLGMSNGKYVPDARGSFLYGDDTHIVADTPDDFVHSTTTWLPRVRMDDETISWEPGATWPNKTQVQDMQHVSMELEETIRRLRRKGPVYIIFHDYTADLKLLRHLGMRTSSWTSMWDNAANNKKMSKQQQKTAKKFRAAADGAAAEGEDDDDDEDPVMRETEVVVDVPGLEPVVVLDTKRLFAALEDRSLKQGTNLGRMTAALTSLGTGQNKSLIVGLHNAANDAFYTLISFAVMASGPPLLQHREKLKIRLQILEEARQKALEAKKAKKEAWQQAKSKGGAGDDDKKRKLDEQAAHDRWGPPGGGYGSRRSDFRDEEQATAAGGGPGAYRGSSWRDDQGVDSDDGEGGGWRRGSGAGGGADGPHRYRSHDDRRSGAADDDFRRELAGWRDRSTGASRHAPPPSNADPRNPTTARSVPHHSESAAAPPNDNRPIAASQPAPPAAAAPASISAEAEHRIKMLEIQVANLGAQLETLTNVVLSSARTNAALNSLQGLFGSSNSLTSSLPAAAPAAAPLPAPSPAPAPAAIDEHSAPSYDSAPSRQHYAQRPSRDAPPHLHPASTGGSSRASIHAPPARGFTRSSSSDSSSRPPSPGPRHAGPPPRKAFGAEHGGYHKNDGYNNHHHHHHSSSQHYDGPGHSRPSAATLKNGKPAKPWKKGYNDTASSSTSSSANGGPNNGGGGQYNAFKAYTNSSWAHGDAEEGSGRRGTPNSTVMDANANVPAPSASSGNGKVNGAKKWYENDRPTAAEVEAHEMWS